MAGICTGLGAIAAAMNGKSWSILLSSAMKNKSVEGCVAALFKKWIVRRPKGQCQILFSLMELDDFVREIILEVKKSL